MSWPQTKKKNLYFEVSSSLILYNKPFLDQTVMGKEKCDNRWRPAQLLDWEAPERSPKPKLHRKQGHGHCVCDCRWSDTLRLSESRQNRYFWEVCSANPWETPETPTPAASVGQRKAPSSRQQGLIPRHTMHASKVEQIGLCGFASSAVFAQPVTNWPPLRQAPWQLSAGKTPP